VAYSVIGTPSPDVHKLSQHASVAEWTALEDNIPKAGEQDTHLSFQARHNDEGMRMMICLCGQFNRRIFQQIHILMMMKILMDGRQ